jgi:hypothetical protein
MKKKEHLHVCDRSVAYSVIKSDGKADKRAQMMPNLMIFLFTCTRVPWGLYVVQQWGCSTLGKKIPGGTLIY